MTTPKKPKTKLVPARELSPRNLTAKRYVERFACLICEKAYRDLEAVEVCEQKHKDAAQVNS